MSSTNIAAEISRINTAVGVIRAAMANLGISVSSSDTIDILAAKLRDADIKTGGDMNYYGECTTASATAAKVVTIEDFKLETGAIVAVRFVNPIIGSATLNVSGKGAKSLIFRGYALQAGIINAGDIATFIYDGTNFKLISIDNPWKARIELTGDEDGLITVTNTTYGISEQVQLDSTGHATYVAKRPGTYTFTAPEE